MSLLASLALAVLAGSPRAAGAPTCAEAFKPDYDRLWRIPRPAWEKGCAEGRDADELLRAFQRGYMTSCTTRFDDAVETGRTNSGLVQAFCAQGVPGEERLARQLGVPVAPSAKEARLAGKRPGRSGMGPASASLEEVHAKWKSDACLAAMDYRYERGDVPLEGYTYRFWSAAEPEGSFRVAWKDKAQAGDVKALSGPESGPSGRITAGGCLGTPGVGLEPALEGARRMGLDVEGAPLLEASLQSPGVWREGRGSSLSERQQRLAAGKELWVVSVGDGVAVIDASTGKSVFLLRR